MVKREKKSHPGVASSEAVKTRKGLSAAKGVILLQRLALASIVSNFLKSKTFSVRQIATSKKMIDLLQVGNQISEECARIAKATAQGKPQKERKKSKKELKMDVLCSEMQITVKDLKKAYGVYCSIYYT